MPRGEVSVLSPQPLLLKEVLSCCQTIQAGFKKNLLSCNDRTLQKGEAWCLPGFLSMNLNTYESSDISFYFSLVHIVLFTCTHAPASRESSQNKRTLVLRKPAHVQNLQEHFLWGFNYNTKCVCISDKKGLGLKEEFTAQAFPVTREWLCSEPEELIIKHSCCHLLTNRISDGCSCGKQNGFHMSVCFFNNRVSKQSSSKAGGSVRFGRWKRHLWHEIQVGQDLVGERGGSGEEMWEEANATSVWKDILQFTSFRCLCYHQSKSGVSLTSGQVNWVLTYK